MKKNTRITIDGRSYGPGDTIEITRDGKTIRSVVPDLEAPSEELTDEQLDAVSGGWPSCTAVCNDTAFWMSNYLCWYTSGGVGCYCSISGDTLDNLVLCFY